MTWNNNDREESKPTWLNPSQKINCVRTVKGWEIPLHGTSLGANYDGLKLYNGAGFGGTGMTNSVPHMELLVTMPLNPADDPNLVVSVTGVHKDFHFGTSTTGFSLTAGNTLYYFDANNGSTPFTVGSTSGVDAIGRIVAATAAAGSFTIQLNGFFNPPTALGGPRGVISGGTWLALNTATTGSTAVVSSVVSILPSTATNYFYADRIVATGGATSGQGWNGDAPNYRPYITCPFNADSATAGGFDGAGLSFGSTGAYDRVAGVAVAGGTGFGFYGVNGYGVSTLNFPGATAFIKVVANDSNFTQNISFSLPANSATNPQQFGTTAKLFTGTQLVDGTIPPAVYAAFFGPTAAVNNNIAVLRIERAGATANTSAKATVLATDNGVGGLTGISTFTISFGAAANG
jgi:hypothetical protein